MNKLDRLFQDPIVPCVKQNNIVTSTAKTAINQQNTELLFDWLEFLRDRHLNESTIKTYQQTINLIFCWDVLYNDNTCILQWDEYDLVSFYTWCIVDNKLKANRVRFLRQVLFKFIDYLTQTHPGTCVELLNIQADLRSMERALRNKQK